MPRVRPRHLPGVPGRHEDAGTQHLVALELEHVRSFREVVARQCDAMVDLLVSQYAAAVEELRGPLQVSRAARQSFRQQQAGAAGGGPDPGRRPSLKQQQHMEAAAAAAASAPSGRRPSLRGALGRLPSKRGVSELEPEQQQGPLERPRRPSLPQQQQGWEPDRPLALPKGIPAPGSSVGDEPVPSPRERRESFRDNTSMNSTVSSFPEESLRQGPTPSRRKGRRMSVTSSRVSDVAAAIPKKRIILFTDMSPECDDECALLYLLSDLNNKEEHVIIELIMADSEIRFRWMEYLFHDKFANGKWQLSDNCSSFKAGTVLVNMFLLHSPNREAMVIEEFKKKAPSLNSEAPGRSMLKFLPHSSLAAGAADAVLLSAPVPDLEPDFFDRFTDVKGVYVVGTPGGVNCQQPSWSGLLYALHQLAPVVYLSPQFTRLVRFPKAYVEANPHWTAYMKRTIFDMALTCMARRPEIPAKFGDWGLVLRLNAANAKLCQGWFEDVMGMTLEQVGECPASIKAVVDAYVERNSGEDRKIGGVVAELRLLGVATRAALDDQGKPRTPEDLQILREEYRSQLFRCVYYCVQTTESLIFQNSANFETLPVSNQFRKMRLKSGYASPHHSLANIFGADEAINILKELPIQVLTPAYDMVGAICVLDLLESGFVDGLGLRVVTAEESIGRGLFTPERQQQDNSPHEILLVGEQEDQVIEAVVNLLRSQIDSDPILIIDEFWTQMQSTLHMTRHTMDYEGVQSMLASPSDVTHNSRETSSSVIVERVDRYMGSCVLHPASAWRVAWCMAGFLLILYDCVTVPLQAFGLQQVWAMSVVTAAFWSADMLQSFNVGYYQGGMIEMRLHQTIRRYLRTWFCLDVVIVVTSWAAVFAQPQRDEESKVDLKRVLGMAWLLRLFKLSRLSPITKAFADAMGWSALGHGLKAFEMVVVMLGLVHMGACGWYAIAEDFGEGDKSWVKASLIDDSDITYMYVTCLQWSFLNLLFTPLESMSPTNTFERLYSLAMEVGGLIMFSTLLSSLTGFMARLVEVQAEQARVDDQVRQYFEDRRLSAMLVGQIENYRRHTMTHSERRKLPREQVPGLEELPESLAIKLSCEIFGPELCKHGFFQFFNEAKPEQFAISVHRMMKEVFLLPSNEVFFKDQVAHHFYIVKEGTLSFFIQGGEELAEAGQWISELALWVDSWRRKGTLVSSSSSMLHSLSIAEFHGCAMELKQLGRMGCRYAELVARGIQRSEVPFTDLNDLWMDVEGRNGMAQRLQAMLD